MINAVCVVFEEYVNETSLLSPYLKFALNINLCVFLLGFLLKGENS